LTLVLTYGYGYDWINYYDAYDNIIHGHYELPFEPGYYLIMRAFALFDAPYQVMSAFTTLIILYLTNIFCTRTNNPGMSFFVIFSFMGFFMFTEQVRQGIAVCIMMLSLQSLQHGRVLKPMMMLIIAMLFHVSAIICVLYIFIINGDSKKSIIKFMLYVSTVLFMVLYLLFNPTVISFIPYLYVKLQGYANSYSEDVISVIRLFFSKAALINILMLILFFKVNDKERHLSLSIKGVFFIIISKIAHFLTRFQFFFVPFIVIGVDQYFVSKRGGRVLIVKSIYLISVLLLSLTPMFSDIYYKSTNSPLLITANQYEINNVIYKRCFDLYKFDPLSNNIGICTLLKKNYSK
jgi:hypothetical protein